MNFDLKLGMVNNMNLYFRKTKRTKSHFLVVVALKESNDYITLQCIVAYMEHINLLICNIRIEKK